MKNAFVDTILLRIYDSEKDSYVASLNIFFYLMISTINIDMVKKESLHLIKIDEIVKKYSIPIGYYLVLAIYDIRIRGIDPSLGKHVEYYYAVFPDSIEYGGFQSWLISILCVKDAFPLSLSFFIVNIIIGVIESMPVLAVIRISRCYRTNVPREVRKFTNIIENNSIKWMFGNDKIIIRKASGENS